MRVFEFIFSIFFRVNIQEQAINQAVIHLNSWLARFCSCWLMQATMLITTVHYWNRGQKSKKTFSLVQKQIDVDKLSIDLVGVSDAMEKIRNGPKEISLYAKGGWDSIIYSTPGVFQALNHGRACLERMGKSNSS